MNQVLNSYLCLALLDQTNVSIYGKIIDFLIFQHATMIWYFDVHIFMFLNCSQKLLHIFWVFATISGLNSSPCERLGSEKNNK